ncbi:ABC transporter permease [Gordonibacter sp. 28C]|uniref:FecCD family ABC transporter permease n=1 Tax=Gordonibacter sp. 28C TaxID=2078569 RepID=UPI000DF815B2|nr:iron ABC transporter permease [Gordonibacter sp. 28C]RDB63167.1 ABC transporter permease [Gordonibacter sp. 28C]
MIGEEGASDASSIGSADGVPRRAAEPESPRKKRDDQDCACLAPSAVERRANYIIVGLAVFMVVAVGVSLMLGRYPIAPDEAVSMLLGKVFPVDQTWTAQQETLFFNVRLPRIMLALMVGCCLSAAGAAFQGTFQNPLASPDILGASQGAAFGAALAILAGSGAFAVSMSAFGFSLLAVLLVLLVSGRAKGNRVLVTVLAGVMISMLFQAGVSFTKLVADPTDDLPAITYWLMGSLTGAKLDTNLLMTSVPMGIGLIVLFALRWRINILTMGDDEAATMGIDARKLRLVVILAATLVTAASVSVSGMIGWVGLIIPHLCRMVVGANYRKLMPASMLMGASFLLIVDNISRLATTAEIPVGILTAFVGAPFFLYLITRKKQQ